MNGTYQTSAVRSKHLKEKALEAQAERDLREDPSDPLVVLQRFERALWQRSGALVVLWSCAVLVLAGTLTSTEAPWTSGLGSFEAAIFEEEQRWSRNSRGLQQRFYQRIQKIYECPET